MLGMTVIWRRLGEIAVLSESEDGKEKEEEEGM